MTMPDFQEPVAPSAAPGPAVEPDEDAPWGRRADGTPRAKPGAKPGVKAAGPRRAAAPGPRKATGAKKATEIDYRPALIGLGHLPIGIASMAARLIRKEQTRAAVQLDALATKVHLPGIAEAVNSIAQTNSKVANALDRIVSVGPYGEVIAAVSPLILQVMVNHRMMEPNPAMGLYSPEELLKAAGV